MKKLKIALFALFTFLGMAASSYACDWCLISQGLSPLETVRGGGVRLNERFTVLNSIYSGTQELANPGAKEEYWTTDITGFYGITENTTLLVNVPLKKTKQRGEITAPQNGTVEFDPATTGGEEGLGDVSVLARYTFYRSESLDASSAAAFVLGIKLPTGKTDGKTDDGSATLDSHLQLGTGSTDYLIGLSASRSMQRVTLSTNLLGAITGKGKFGDTSHQFGNVLNYDLTAKYRIHPSSFAPAGPQVFLALGLNGELRDRETENGEKVRDSGGHTVYLSPGLQIVASRSWIFEINYQQAVYHNLYGTQVGEDYKANAAVTYLF